MLKGKPVIVHGDGTSLWTITHSEDFAKGFIGLFGHQQAIGHAFHITSDELLTWDQIYQAVGAAVGVEPNIVHVSSDFIAGVVKEIGQEWLVGNFIGDKATSAIFDNSKIKAFVPDYRATIPFNKGIKRTIKWMQADKERMNINEFWNETIDAILNKYKK
jgi:nucleoside-diphosphate-sugar epimerase